MLQLTSFRNWRGKRNYLKEWIPWGSFFVKRKLNMKYILITIYAFATGVLLDGKVPKPVIMIMGISVVIIAEVIGY